MQPHSGDRLRLAIAATFTAEPLEPVLRFWMGELGLSGTVQFAPYNQVLQQLYSAHSLLRRADGDAGESVLNVLFVRLEDWMPDEAPLWEERDNGAPGALPLPARLVQNIDQFIAALRAAAGDGRRFLLVLCPPGSNVAAAPSLAEALSLAETSIAEQLADQAQVHVVGARDWVPMLEGADYENRFADRSAHIPYTDAAYAAMATVVMRYHATLHRRPFKVVVVDCDNTLWRGVCGEVGANGVAIDEAHRQFQQFLLRQREQGMLLCLCSKNSESDVFDVFASNTGMVLQKAHLAAWRINWEPKSANLQALAAELDLGLDSFVFIDDNPVECAEVAARCPEVLTIQVPHPIEHLPALLDRLWVFDRARVTEEDRRRADHYRTNAQRRELEQAAPSFADFLTSLNVRVAIEAPAREQHARLAQMTQRTNQFNASSIRRTEAQVADMIDSGRLEARIVDVSDRYGDYGIVGAMLFLADQEAVRVETLLLSCRALGRSVEQRMLRHLGQIAINRGLHFVDIAYVASDRNAPVRNFLDASEPAEIVTNADHAVYRYDARAVAVLDPIAEADRQQRHTIHGSADAADTPAAKSTPRADNRTWLRIAETWTGMDAVAAAAQRTRNARPDLQTPFAPLQTELERRIADIWERVLGIEQPGANDGFAELGGTSLHLVQVHARLQEQLRTAIPLTQLFALPTIRAQAAFFTTDAPEHTTLSGIQQRAQRQKAAIRNQRALQFRQR